MSAWRRTPHTPMAQAERHKAPLRRRSQRQRQTSRATASNPSPRSSAPQRAAARVRPEYALEFSISIPWSLWFLCNCFYKGYVTFLFSEGKRVCWGAGREPLARTGSLKSPKGNPEVPDFSFLSLAYSQSADASGTAGGVGSQRAASGHAGCMSVSSQRVAAKQTVGGGGGSQQTAAGAAGGASRNVVKGYALEGSRNEAAWASAGVGPLASSDPPAQLPPVRHARSSWV